MKTFFESLDPPASFSEFKDSEDKTVVGMNFDGCTEAVAEAN